MSNSVDSKGPVGQLYEIGIDVEGEERTLASVGTGNIGFRTDHRAYSTANLEEVPTFGNWQW